MKNRAGNGRIDLRGGGLSPEHFVRYVVEPSLCWLHEARGLPPTEAVRLFLVAVAVQETGLRHRWQAPAGPGRSFWQFEPATVGALLNHPVSREVLADYLSDFALPRGETDLHDVLAYHDGAAAVAARLLLRCDPMPVPIGAQDAWAAYLRVWRPGKPSGGRWAASWDAALRGVALRGQMA